MVNIGIFSKNNTFHVNSNCYNPDLQMSAGHFNINMSFYQYNFLKYKYKRQLHSSLIPGMMGFI